MLGKVCIIKSWRPAFNQSIYNYLRKFGDLTHISLDQLMSFSLKGLYKL